MKYFFTYLATTALVAAFATSVTAQTQVNGFKPQRFTVVVEGQGPDVVFIPGLACPRDVWEDVRLILRETHRIHLIQFRGFGDPPGINAQAGSLLRPFVDELASYLRHQKLGAVDVVGHSVGGLSAMMLALHHPDTTNKLLIVDALPFVGLIFHPNSTVEQFQPQVQAMLESLKNAPMPASGSRSDPEVYVRMSNTEQTRQTISDWAAACDQHIVTRVLCEALSTDLRGRLAELQTPTTVLYPFDGSQGTQQGVENLYATAYAGNKKINIVKIDQARHFLMLDAPEVFMSVLKDFLAQ